MRSLSLFLLACPLALFPASLVVFQEKSMPKNAQEYIAAFQRGEDFAPPSVGLLRDGKPDSAAVQLLASDLASDSPHAREKLVALLVDLGLRTDPLTPKGAEVLRDRQIISALADAGLAKPDLGREAAMDALRKLVTSKDLAPFGEAFSAALDKSPSDESFLLVAKAKPERAKPIVDRLARLPRWKDVESAKIARAALGSQEVESEFLAAANSANDGGSLAKALGPLALIGTPRTLKAVAERLRTPLTIDMPGAYEKSVRLNVLEALLYNFPDQPVLYPNNILSEADYSAAEQFCVQTLGVKYTAPPPPFLTYRGYPIPLPR